MFCLCKVKAVVLPVRRSWVALILLFLTSSWAIGAGPLTPADVAKLRSVTSAVISPDGRHVAYTLSLPRNPFQDPDGDAWSELHVVDSQGNSRPFVTGQVNVGSLQWTGDGKQITFLAKRQGQSHRAWHAIAIDGGEARCILEHKEDILSLAQSHDGESVAFLARDPLPEAILKYREKGFRPEIYEEDWRPVRVWIAPRDGSSPPRALDLPGSAHDVQWRPGDQQLAVVFAPTPLVDDSYMFKRIRVVDVVTGKITDRVDNPGKLGHIEWSPDGKHLAMVAGADENDPREGRLMVATIPFDGQLRDVSPKEEIHVTSFAWADPDTIAWIAADSTKTIAGTVKLGGQSEIADWKEGPIAAALTVAGNGSIALVGHRADHPPEVYWTNRLASPPRRLTVSNAWLQDRQLARQETITWKARDDLSLEGVLIYPVNYEAGRRYPLILIVHGGPEAHVSDGWVTSYSRPGQVAAARGFAVFYPNYRGSTGRGVAFSKMGQADAAGKEFDDLVDAVDHLIAMGLVDRDKVGITGGSYGGYASAWGATYYSDRFAASVMFVGISDNVSKIGTTDIPEEMYLVHHRKRLWDDWTYFLDRSPIRYVQRNRTPTLILHGKEDPRVHPSQSLELYRHLKTLKQAPVRLVLYPGEGHGNRRAAGRLDYQLRLLRWMEHYLQGPGGDPPDYRLDYEKVERNF